MLLKYQNKIDFDLKFAVQQVAARQKVKSKLPTWASDPRLLFPVSISLEQCSSEITAKYKADFLKGKRLIDLTGGFGVDTYFLSEHFEEAVYLERNAALGEIASHNFSLLAGEKIRCVTGDSLENLRLENSVFDWIYLDPARRGDHNQKLYKLSDCEPDVVENWELLSQSANNIMIKTSPMLDIKAALDELPEVNEVMVISVKNEVKEVVLVQRQAAAKDQAPIINCINLTGNGEQVFQFDFPKEENAKASFGTVVKYIIEPNASIMKAGGFKSFSEQFGLAKLHPNSHLYTSSTLPESIPGRVFQVVEELKPDRKVFKRFFPSGKVNIITRNYPLKPEEIKKKFRLKDGGDDFLIGTTTSDGKPRLFLCKKH
nr:class I SAM-dependent methyltransferase [Litoribacter alkaliphilus]